MMEEEKERDKGGIADLEKGKEQQGKRNESDTEKRKQKEEVKEYDTYEVLNVKICKIIEVIDGPWR